MIDGHELCRGERDILERKIKALESIIAKYANHVSWCDINHIFPELMPCDCGLDELQEEVKKLP